MSIFGGVLWMSAHDIEGADVSRRFDQDTVETKCDGREGCVVGGGRCIHAELAEASSNGWSPGNKAAPT